MEVTCYLFLLKMDIMPFFDFWTGMSSSLDVVAADDGLMACTDASCWLVIWCWPGRGAFGGSDMCRAVITCCVCWVCAVKHKKVNQLQLQLEMSSQNENTMNMQAIHQKMVKVKRATNHIYKLCAFRPTLHQSRHQIESRSARDRYRRAVAFVEECRMQIEHAKVARQTCPLQVTTWHESVHCA